MMAMTMLLLELADLRSGRRVRFFKQCPDSRPDVLPEVEFTVLVSVLQTEAFHYVFLCQFICVEVEPVEDL